MNTPYSDWLKVDLHIHTDWSKKTKENDYQENFDVETLKTRLNENKVKLFSLTDHNIINIDAYKEYYGNYDPENDPFLLVGVELDIIVGPNEETYHTLIIFNKSSDTGAQYVHDKLEKEYRERGCEIKKRVISIDILISLFPEDDFFFIPHAASNKNIIKPYKNNIRNAQKMIILMQSAMEKVKEQKRHCYNEGFDKILTNAFQQKNDHAYIEFSDNHCINSYPYSSNRRDKYEHIFYYVKGEKSFETLRQAFIDPQSRIKSTEQYNSIKRSMEHLESIRINGIDFIEDTVLRFSPHMNVFIGGRSTGKSLLMTLIVQKIDSIRGRPKHPYHVDTEKIEIKALRDENYCRETSIAGDLVTYVQQGEIVSYFEKHDLQELASNTGRIEEYMEAKSYFEELGKTLDSLVDDLANTYDFCHRKSDEKFILHDYTVNCVLTNFLIFQWDEKMVSSEGFSMRNIEHDKDIIKTLLSSINEFRNCSLFKLTEEDKASVDTFETLVKNKSAEVSHIEQNSSRRSSFIVSVKEFINNTNDQLHESSRLKHEASREISRIKEEASLKFQNLRKLKTKSSKLVSFKYNIQKELDLHDEIRLIMELKDNEIGDLNSLIIDGIKNGREEESLYLNLCALLRGETKIKYLGDTDKESLLKKMHSQIADFRQLFSSPADHLNYGDGDTSLNKSPGYNSEKYLQIVLKNNKTSIIFIDQPEDNLGNAFIADQLVEMMRTIKFNKQIFLVTHNPSVVVHGDAENVIVCTNESNKVQYSQMAIEDEGAQKKICKILDGGEYIFHTRSRKYNIQKLMKGDTHAE